MKILIIGGTRFIGRNLALFLNKLYEVTILSRSKSTDKNLNQIYLNKFDLNLDHIENFDICIDFTVFSKKDCRFSESLIKKVGKYYIISSSWIQFVDKKSEIFERSISEEYLLNKLYCEERLLKFNSKFASIRLPPVIGNDICKRLSWDSWTMRKIESSYYGNYLTDLIHINAAIENIHFLFNEHSDHQRNIFEVGYSKFPKLSFWTSQMKKIMKDEKSIYIDQNVSLKEYVLIQSLAYKRVINCSKCETIEEELIFKLMYDNYQSN